MAWYSFPYQVGMNSKTDLADYVFEGLQCCTDRWKSGHCRFGDSCNFAHGEEEIRQLPPRGFCGRWRGAEVGVALADMMVAHTEVMVATNKWTRFVSFLHVRKAILWETCQQILYVSTFCGSESRSAVQFACCRISFKCTLFSSV